MQGKICVLQRPVASQEAEPTSDEEQPFKWLERSSWPWNG
jgi:hypothetical protein